MNAVSINTFFQQLLYQPAEPLLFTSGFFLFFFLVVSCFYPFVARAKHARMAYLILFSLYYYYKTSGLHIIVLLTVAMVGFTMGLMMGTTEKKWEKRIYFLTGLASNLGILLFFKYTNFLLQTVNALVRSNFPMVDIVLPLGISFFTFQSVGYLIDAYRGTVPPVRSVLEYGFFLTFFPQLIAGPIARASHLLPQIRKDVSISREDIGKGLFLILCGVIKKAVIADYISMNFVDRIFDNPLLYSGLENLAAVYGYALQIYCDFSGYSDIAIGMALLLGFSLQNNFNSPYQATSVTEFWKRWHISLSTWFRDYLFLPLAYAFARRFTKDRYLNVKADLWVYACSALVTFTLCGVWHGADWKFVLWGAMHGVALIVEKAFRLPRLFARNRLWRIFGVVVTFHFVCFCWIFFRSSSFASAADVLYQIVFFFRGRVFLQFLAGYPAVVAAIVVGYLLHFASERSMMNVQTIVTAMPLVVKSLALALVIWIVIQTRSAEIQPFIYFNF